MTSKEGVVPSRMISIPKTGWMPEDTPTNNKEPTSAPMHIFLIADLIAVENCIEASRINVFKFNIIVIVLLYYIPFLNRF